MQTDLERAVAQALFRRYLAANRWRLGPPDWDAWPEFHDTCIEDARAAIAECFAAIAECFKCQPPEGTP